MQPQKPKLLSSEIFIKIRSLREILDTHPDLNDTNKKYTIDLTSSLLKKTNIDLDKFVLFLLYTNKCSNTGRFCLTYNEYLDTVIKEQNEKVLTNLITDFKENIFFELYDNKLLDEDEKRIIKQMLDLEYTVSKLTVQNCIKNENISSLIFKVDSESVYFKTYNRYIADQQLNYVYTGIPENIFVKTTENNINKLYIFPFLDLLFVVTKENKNPQTNLPFDEQNFQNLTNKYSKEIKLIKRYLKGKK